MSDICTDNRFELIAKYKAKLIEATNIETSADEMAVIDNILFRLWQMGWLDQLEQPAAATRWVRCEERLPEKNGAYAACWLYSEQYYWEKAIFWDGKWKLANGNGLMEPDYWMPLPEPPTGTERSET